MRVFEARAFLVFLSVGAVAAACGGGSSSSSQVFPRTQPSPSATSPIAHVIVVVQENRSFDNLFSTFPGADGTTTGKVAAVPPSLQSQCPVPQATTVPLAKTGLRETQDFGHNFSYFLTDYHKGSMDGFDLARIPGNTKLDCLHPYVYVDPLQIKPYWDLATQYVLADHVFQTQASGSFTAHQDLIAAGTRISSSASVIDDPGTSPWGCDSPPGTKTGLITTKLIYKQFAGPFPCFTQYQTLRDLLDAKGVTWKFYTPTIVLNKETAGNWDAFDAIKAVRGSPEWATNVVSPDTVIFNDLKNGSLPAVSWVIPDAFNSDHPQECCINHRDVDLGPQWVTSLVNAIGQSSYWNTCAIVILWDDWGGFYDHESPAFLRDDQGGLGFRIPVLIVSPYVQPHIEHTQYETASIVKFIEVNFQLSGPLQEPDARAAPLTNAFNFNQTPRPFQPIVSKYSRAFFLHQQPSGLPVDKQ
ncbi:MAG TPA: alkaline phosphatase family protein [Candidatus Cybelea sp.]|nr:alkaline phosphatase family protein [Candidatus Cybelea sp.]